MSSVCNKKKELDKEVCEEYLIQNSHNLKVVQPHYLPKSFTKYLPNTIQYLTLNCF